MDMYQKEVRLRNSSDWNDWEVEIEIVTPFYYKRVNLLMRTEVGMIDSEFVYDTRKGSRRACGGFLRRELDETMAMRVDRKFTTCCDGTRTPMEFR